MTTERTTRHRQKKQGTSPDETSSSSAPIATPASNALVQGDWQAIWAPQHNMYYFYNMRTNETTWTNPWLARKPLGPRSLLLVTMPKLQRVAQGIDPALAFLDPSLAAGPSNPGAFTYAAKFNAEDRHVYQDGWEEPRARVGVRKNAEDEQCVLRYGCLAAGHRSKRC